MTDESVKSPYEEEEIRCPKLGGQITFSYCRVESGDRPCARALGCWRHRFDVEGFFKETLQPEVFESCFKKAPPSKLETLMEMIERAKRIAEKSEETGD